MLVMTSMNPGNKLTVRNTDDNSPLTLCKNA
jgi:hypothetical protein